MNHNDTIPNSTTTIIPTRGSSAMDLSGADSILLNPKDSPEEKVLPSLVSLPPLPSLDQPSCAAQLPPIVGVGALEVQGFEGKHMRIFTPPTRASGGATATATATAAAAINGSNSSLDINSVSNVELHSISSQKFLSKYFHLPIVEAAKELGMCTTMLKKLCRRCGISRWPYRKVNTHTERERDTHNFTEFIYIIYNI